MAFKHPTCVCLNVHAAHTLHAIVEHEKEEFAKYFDDMESVEQFLGYLKQYESIVNTCFSEDFRKGC